MYNLDKAIVECVRNELFHFPTLFLKQSSEPTSITVIGISNDFSRTRKECRERGGVTIEIYEISLDYCMSLILSHDILLNSLFSTTVCLKDDLDISRMILQSLKPILLYNNMRKAPAISQAWDVAASEPVALDDKLAMRFYNISDDISFIFNVFIPVHGLVRSCGGTNTPSLQFYNIMVEKMPCTLCVSIMENKVGKPCSPYKKCYTSSLLSLIVGISGYPISAYQAWWRLNADIYMMSYWI